jgi:hypothetical protein
MTSPDLQRSLDQALAEIASLRGRVDEMERSSQAFAKLPRTAMLDGNFLTRAFAVWGHQAVAGLMIAVPIWVFLLMTAIVCGGFR